MAQTPLYRYFRPNVGHFYTTNFAELGQAGAGYVFERVECLVENIHAPNTTELFRFRRDNYNEAHFYTTTKSEGMPKEGTLNKFVYEGVQCYVYPVKSNNLIALHRYRNGQDYFYTTFKELRASTAWNNIKNGVNHPFIPEFQFDGVQCWVIDDNT